MLTKFGAIITDGRGKVGSFYIGKNHYGTYLAEIVPPANPQTTFQQLRRAQQAILTAQWKTLSVDEQNLWIDETANYPRTNSIGNEYFLTGQTLFIGLNLNLWLVGIATITVPGTKRIPPDTGTFSFTVTRSIDSCLVTMDRGTSDGNATYVFYFTDGLSTGKFYISTKYRSTAIQAMDGFTSYDFTANYFALFPSAAVGAKVFAKVLTVDSNCGAMSLPFFSTIVIS